ncbi:related to Putative amidase C550.07 [Saccharomycodes ludwigii]|uniref:amidase n=1 Tax=Saccharomycodes ludwigii TaxID=36035 RepID=A0A376B951_9ASCO|nr:related to Putative amidase C550.07 [Saccharomycodes ludwigii]
MNGKVYPSEDPGKYKSFIPLIDAYNEAKLKQIKEYDPEFYAKCVEIIPTAEELDASPISFMKYNKKLLSPMDFEIVTNYSMQELVAKQISKELTALSIINAYIKSAIISHLITNCAMQFLIPEALAKANYLDKFLSKNNGEVIGPLHGVPISIKEHMNYAGKQTCGSYVGCLDNIPRESAINIKILDKLGANFHIRTSQPQSLMWLDTANNIIGRTRNPLSTRMSPGGSSGGEGACVASHGSCIGFGGDIGGSIRVPAAFTNLFGFRPTTRIFSSLNNLGGGKGQETIIVSQGPLARSIEEIDFFMESFVNKGIPSNYDPSCLPLPWRTPVELPKKIKIGCLFDDNLVTPFPAISRGMKLVVEKLAENFELVDLKNYWYSESEMESIYTNAIACFTSDGNQTQYDMFEKSGEPILPLTSHYFQFGDNAGKPLSVYDVRMLAYERDNLRLDLYKKFFGRVEDGSLGLDFILAPSYVGPSETPGNSLYWGYTVLWNYVDFPSCVFPTGLFHETTTDVLPFSNGGPKLKNNQYEKMVWYGHNEDKINYDPKNYVGGPIALQLISRRFADEEVLEGVKKIVDILNIPRS